MKIEDFYPIINRVIRKYRTKYPMVHSLSLVDNDDLYNECIIIIINLLPKCEDESTFLDYIEKTLFYRLIDITTKMGKTYPLDVLADDITIGEDESHSSKDYNYYLQNVLNEFLKNKSQFHKDLVNESIMEKSLSAAAVARKHKKSTKTVLAQRNRLLYDIKDLFFDTLNDQQT